MRGRSYSLLLGGLLVAWSCGSSERFRGTGSGRSEDAAGGASSAGEAGTGGSAGDRSSEPESSVVGGQGGASEEQPAELRVVSTSPSEDASAVERDALISVKFSGELDPDTVNNESFVVAGPDGVVAGKLSVSDDTITFVADSAWSLLADYGVTLAPTIADAAGVALSAKLTFGFQTREVYFGSRNDYQPTAWST